MIRQNYTLFLTWGYLYNIFLIFSDFQTSIFGFQFFWKCHPSINSEQYDECCLHRVDDEHEHKGEIAFHTIEDEHRFHREMPWTSPIGCGYDNGYAAHDKGDEGAVDAEVGRLLEAVERQVEVDEITQPDTDGICQVEGDVVYFAEGDDALPEIAGGVLHFVSDMQLLQQQPYEDAGSDEADESDKISCGGELAKKTVEAGACGVEEVDKHRKLQQQCCSGDEQHYNTVHRALGDHGAERLGKCHAIIALEHAAAHELTHAGNEQTGGIAEEDGVDRSAESCMLTDGFQCLSPSHAAEQLGGDAEGQRQQHPSPVHLIPHGVADQAEVKVAVHPIEDGSSQYEGKKHFGDLLYRIAHDMTLLNQQN